MPLTDVLVSALSGPAGKVIRGPLRTIVLEVLEDRGYASPQEVQALRMEISSLESRMAGIQGQLQEAEALAAQGQGEMARLAEELEKAVRRAAVAEAAAEPVLVEDAPPGLEADEQDLDAEELELDAEDQEPVEEDLVVAPDLPDFLEAELPAEPDATDAPDASIVPALSSQARRCRVVACNEEPSRAGFCQDHLHAWTSGRLEGHVSPEGLIDVSGHPFRVGSELAGEAYAVSDTEPPMVEVGGMRVDAAPMGV
jgi:hypothetical protein